MNEYIATDGTRWHFECLCPPIPIRAFDWAATEDGYEPGWFVAYGETREKLLAAIEEYVQEQAHTKVAE